MENKILKTEATLEGVSLRRDGSCTLHFSTQEILDEDFLTIKQFYGKFGNLLFASAKIQPKDIPQNDPEYEGKSPSQRLRAVIFVLFSQMRDGGKTEKKFDDFYGGIVENLITQIKEKLNPL